MKRLNIIFALFLLLAACTKQQQNNMTGVWASAGVTYYFFDDSRFQQSDRPGEQWVWTFAKGRVNLYGNGGAMDRLWAVEFLTPDRVQVIEQDTFEIWRQ